VIGSTGHFGALAAPVAGRAKAHADSRAACDRPDDPDVGNGPVGPPVAPEIGTEVDYLDRVAAVVDVLRRKDRGVAQVGLLGGRTLLDLDRPESRLWRLSAEQGGKYWIAVDPRHAAPDDLAGRVDQPADLAVADREEVEPAHALLATKLSSQASAAGTPSRRKDAAVSRSGPTRIPLPPSPAAALKPGSSVRSSPMNTGRAPFMSGSRIRRSIAVPLSPPGARTSTISLPG